MASGKWKVRSRDSFVVVGRAEPSSLPKRAASTARRDNVRRDYCNSDGNQYATVRISSH
jgi:hypothetical protein